MCVDVCYVCYMCVAFVYGTASATHGRHDSKQRMCVDVCRCVLCCVARVLCVCMVQRLDMAASDGCVSIRVDMCFIVLYVCSACI